MRKSAPFQIASKLRGTPTDNGFKQVQIAYLAVISNLERLVTRYLCKSDCWQTLGLAKQRLALWPLTDKFNFHVNKQWRINDFRVQRVKVFLPSFYPWCHSREKMYQALSRFIILQVTGSWVRAWERGYRWITFFQTPVQLAWGSLNQATCYYQVMKWTQYPKPQFTTVYTHIVPTKKERFVWSWPQSDMWPSAQTTNSSPITDTLEATGWTQRTNYNAVCGLTQSHLGNAT